MFILSGPEGRTPPRSNRNRRVRLFLFPKRKVKKKEKKKVKRRKKKEKGKEGRKEGKKRGGREMRG